MLRRLTAVAAVLVASTLVPLTGAAAGTQPDPMAGAPAVGDCFDLTLKQVSALSVTEDPVDCAEDHTAVVMEAMTLPSRLDWDSPKQEVDTFILHRCEAAYRDLVGSNTLQLYRSLYGWFFFEPTAGQRDAGARWFDCMTTVQDARGLADLPDPLPRVSNHLPDEVARCVTAKYASTPCAEKHAWRSSYAFYATGKATDRNIAAAADRVCPQHVTSRRWLRSGLDVKGKRFVVGCYSRTPR